MQKLRGEMGVSAKIDIGRGAVLVTCGEVRGWKN